MPKSDIVLSLEQALNKANVGHKFQTRALIILGLLFLIIGMLNLILTHHFLHQSEFKCYNQEMDLIPCSEQEFCEQNGQHISGENFVYESDLGEVVQYYSLVCSKALQITMLMATYYLGGVFGSIYYGEQMEIRQGRYTVMIETLLLLGGCCCVSVLSPSAYILSVALFAINFFMSGFMTSSMILLFEISSNTLQQMSIPILFATWGMGEILGPSLIETYNMNWQQVMLILFGGPIIVFSIVIKVLKESPRVLILKKKFNEAKQVINHICNVNWISMPEDWKLEGEFASIELPHISSNESVGDSCSNYVADELEVEQKKCYSYQSLYQFKSIKSQLVIILYLILTITFGITLNTNSLQFYLQYERNKVLLILSILSMTGYLFAIYAAVNYQRIPTIKTFTLMMVFLLLIGSIIRLDSLKILMLFGGRIGLSFGQSYITLYAIETLPTSLRHYGLSLMISSTQFLQLFQDGQDIHALGMISSMMMILLLLIGSILVYRLRETFGQPLKQNVEELDGQLLNKVQII